MKVFQIVNGICGYQFPYASAAEAVGKYASNIQIEEAPDYVFEGWGFLDGTFIRPTPPQGWLYDEKTGTFYDAASAPPSPETEQIAALKTKLAATDCSAIKYADGRLTEAEYAPIKAERQAIRDEINRLEATP